MADNDDRIINSPNPVYIAHPGGLGCTFFEKMWEFQDKLAQIDALTGAEETYKSLLQRCIRTAAKMRSKGVTQDDIICICSINSMDACVPYIATLFLGAKPSTLDPAYSLHDTIYLLKEVKPKLIFVCPEAVKNIEKTINEASLDSEIVAFGSTLNHIPFSDFLQPHPEEDDFKPRPVKSLKDTATILFSSGTSGLPKGICLNHYGLILMCYQTGQLIHMTRILSFSSFAWVSTINFLITSTLYGGCRVVAPKFDPNELWKLLNTYKPTTLFLAASYAVTLTRIGRPENTKLLNLKMILLGGGSLSEKPMRNFQKMVPEVPVLLGYAQTELNGVATLFNINKPEELALLKQKPTSSGIALPGFSMKIVDPETQELLGPNQSGELRVKTNIVMNGYYNLDSSAAWDSEGWLKTGDIAYYDEDHCFYIVDRIKEMFKFRQIQVAPAIVEAVILQHPAVEGAVVIGIPHEEDGDHPMALVVLSKAAKNVSSVDIEKFVEERVSDAQRLRAGVKIINAIPKTATGKIKRRDLRDKILRGEI